MGNPLLNLLIFTALVALIILGFRPRRGIVARIARRLRQSEQTVEEDALKHVAKAALAGITADIESLAGALQVTRDHAAQLAAQLEAQGWLTSRANAFILTNTGHRYATRIIRHHRLWERYLADRTSVRPEEWHEDAEYHEHRLDVEAAEALAAKMGHPVYDPHGDPIPTTDGELPPARGIALSELIAGDSAVIVHIEDEPQEVYDQLIAGGLAPGMITTVLAHSPREVRFFVEGRELSLTPIAARNVTVERAPRTTAKPRHTLAELAVGEVATVSDISSACHGPERRRLLDLGLVPGTPVRAELESALGEPMAYRVRSAIVALRRRQAEMVTVSRDAVPERDR